MIYQQYCSFIKVCGDFSCDNSPSIFSDELTELCADGASALGMFCSKYRESS